MIKNLYHTVFGSKSSRPFTRKRSIFKQCQAQYTLLFYKEICRGKESFSVEKVQRSNQKQMFNGLCSSKRNNEPWLLWLNLTSVPQAIKYRTDPRFNLIFFKWNLKHLTIQFITQRLNSYSSLGMSINHSFNVRFPGKPLLKQDTLLEQSKTLPDCSHVRRLSAMIFFFK